MFCQNCGTQLKDNAKFCPECGAKVEALPKTCSKCGAELEEGAKFCAECGEPVPQAGMPAAETVQIVGSAAGNAAVSGTSGEASAAAAEAPAGHLKKRWKLLVPIALILAVAVAISTVSAVIEAKKKNPLNRILLAAQNTLKEENFTVHVHATEDYDEDGSIDWNRTFTGVVEYSPDSHLAIGRDGELQMYYTDEYTIDYGTAYFAADWEDFWQAEYHYTYKLLNALGKFILGDTTYMEDFKEAVSEMDNAGDLDGSEVNLDEAAVEEALKRLQEMLSDEKFMETACDYRVLEGSSTTSLTVSIDRYSDFWDRLLECLSPLEPRSSGEGWEDMREALCDDGVWGLEAKLDLQDGKLWKCSYTQKIYDRDGSYVTKTYDFDFYNIGTTRIFGLKILGINGNSEVGSKEEMDRYAQKYRRYPDA